jgi:hypothetical protein
MSQRASLSRVVEPSRTLLDFFSSSVLKLLLQPLLSITCYKLKLSSNTRAYYLLYSLFNLRRPSSAVPPRLALFHDDGAAKRFVCLFVDERVEIDRTSQSGERVVVVVVANARHVRLDARAIAGGEICDGDCGLNLTEDAAGHVVQAGCRRYLLIFFPRFNVAFTFRRAVP